MPSEILAFPFKGDCNKLILSGRLRRRLADTSRFNLEVCGYLISIKYKRSILPIGITTSSIGNTNCVTFDNSYFPAQNDFLQKAKEKIPALVTVQYHNHPRISVSNLDPKTIKFLESGILGGVYDYLRDYGIEPTLENVATEEVTRQLSEQDILSAVGDLSILLTDTLREGNEFSHINAYLIKGKGAYPKKLRVAKLETEDADLIKYHSEMVDIIDLIYQQNYKRNRE